MVAAIFQIFRRNLIFWFEKLIAGRAGAAQPAILRADGAAGKHRGADRAQDPLPRQQHAADGATGGAVVAGRAGAAQPDVLWAGGAAGGRYVKVLGARI